MTGMDKMGQTVLADNSKIKDKTLAKLCWTLQEQIAGQNHGSPVSLVDLLDQGDRREDGPPEIFRKDAEGCIWTGNLAGVFEYHHDQQTERILIGSRFDPKGGAGFFLRAMLETCWDIPMSFLEEFRGSKTDAPYDFLLALRLACQLERAWKRGQLRAYRSRPMYDSRVRGRLDLPRQIRRSMGLSDGRMAYVLRDYSVDQDCVRLFAQALLEMEKRHPDFMGRVQQERPPFRLARRELLQQVSIWERMDRHTLLACTKKRIVNPIYREYEALRVISRAVLRRMGGYQPQETDGAPFVSGVFLDISRLWEMYLEKKVFPQMPPEMPSCQESVSILGNALKIIPDFYWKGRGIVLDAKYRPVWGEAEKREAWPEEVRDDVYQVLSYMLALGCAHGGAVFPVRGQSREPRPSHAGPGSVPRKFWTIGFAVPAGDAYGSFLAGMDQEAGLLAQRLRGSLFP